MRMQRLKNHPLKLALAALALVALAAVACNGDDSSPADGSPSAGDTPIMAVANYIDSGHLDGYQLDINREADCTLEPVQTVTAGTPTTASRLYLAQFCLTSEDWFPDKATTIIVDLPDTGESWEIKLELDSEVSLWKVKDVKKVSG